MELFFLVGTKSSVFQSQIMTILVCLASLLVPLEVHGILLFRAGGAVAGRQRESAAHATDEEFETGTAHATDEEFEAETEHATETDDDLGQRDVEDTSSGLVQTAEEFEADSTGMQP